MAEIIPNGKLYLLKNLKIDNTYENTIIFSTPQAQYNYFISKCPNTATHGYTQVNYQRVNKGVLAIHGVAEEVMKCNYMMFQNSLIFQESNSSTTTTFNWVYAFINDVKYLSTNCCEVYYEIDVLQTFMFRYSLGQCFVEREHTETDEIGEHIIDEGLPVGDYEYSELTEYIAGTGDRTAFVTNSALDIVVAATYIDANTDGLGGSYCGFFSGLVYHGFQNSSAGRTACANFLTSIGSKVADGTVAVFLAPHWAMQYLIDNIGAENAPYLNHKITATQVYQNFGGYTPKNNKMYTYPYNYLYMYNGCGNVAEYRFEKFAQPTPSDKNFTFTEYFDFSCSPSLALVPQAYENIAFNTVEHFTCGPFPQLSWVSDTYKAWIAQNGVSLGASAIASALGLGGSIVNGVMNYEAGVAMANASRTAAGTAAGMASATAGAVGVGVAAVVNILGTVVNLITQIDYAQKLPDQAHGNVNASQLMCIMGEMRYHAYRRYARKDYAMSIDNFFTMFGYKVNKIKVPNTEVRNGFTYVKTANCLLVPRSVTQSGVTTQVYEIPKYYENKIMDIYNNGVRIWRNGDNIGDYSVNNDPISQGA